MNSSTYMHCSYCSLRQVISRKPVLIDAPRPAAINAPRPATFHAPRPATFHTPRPATFHAPRPATFHAPRPATFHAPRPATIQYHCFVAAARCSSRLFGCWGRCSSTTHPRLLLFLVQAPVTCWAPRHKSGGLLRRRRRRTAP